MLLVFNSLVNHVMLLIAESLQVIQL